jgi:hypothetical protein
MKTIQKKFTYKTFQYKQLLREENVAIYEQKLKDAEDGLSLKKNYEVVVIDSHNGYEIAGNIIPPSEMYPSSNQWGVKGFTCLSYEDALVKFKKLKKQETRKNEKQKSGG